MGIANGQTGTFFFKVVDSLGNAAGSSLVTMDFMSEKSDAKGDLEPAAFVVRVKGPGLFSEKVSIVPLPSSIWAGAVLLGVIALVPKRRVLGPSVIC